MESIKKTKIDLIELTKVVWDQRKYIIYTIVVSIIIGLIVALGSKKEYTSYCKLMPESDENFQSSIGGLGSLAGLAGINMNMGINSSILPQHYPMITQSLPFQKILLEKSIRFQKLDTSVTLYKYFMDIYKPSLFEIIYNYTVGMPNQLRALFSEQRTRNKIELSESDNIVNLSYKEYKIIDKLQDRIKSSVEPVTGIISIEVDMPDPRASAELTNHCINVLTAYITEYKTKKSQENLDFIRERYIESKTVFKQTQRDMAIFNDRNRNVTTALAQTELKELQNEYNIAFQIYKELATQLEQAKIQVKEQTPVFTVLEPVKIPLKKSKPKRILIMTISLFLGTIFGIGLVFLRMLYKNLRTNLSNHNVGN